MSFIIFKFCFPCFRVKNAALDDGNFMAEIVIHNWEVSSPQESRHAKYDFQNSWPCEGKDGMVPSSSCA